MEAVTVPITELIKQVVLCKDECDHPVCEYLRTTKEITHKHGLGFTTMEQYADQMEGAATHLLHRINVGYSVRV